ncbi:hypothetical protein FB567DRAFT_614843 [Paraphoma chrysanthemicola]|uniref:DUF7730 domain-containing protein n=1 Tax=Paraphoma chrysanthemicola TaxID=798071 RepID=A0A8K0QUQ8_9PLEO|nr:hypothetical protein FB567DRAFT_614843 [Paraphoma chrysanthemicola]
MGRSLRKSTRSKTNASAKAAKDAGYVRRARQAPTRKQRYARHKGLVSMKIPKDLKSITIANAENSPLLRLPREIRHTIFALPLTRVSRQIYSETATLAYAENCFAFKHEVYMFKWLSKRLLAQREAIRWLMLPSESYRRKEDRRSFSPDLEKKAKKVRKTCPNLVAMEADYALDRILFGSPSRPFKDKRDRDEEPSSEDFSVDSSEDAWKDFREDSSEDSS